MLDESASVTFFKLVAASISLESAILCFAIEKEGLLCTSPGGGASTLH